MIFQSGIAESDFALALNRYLCGSVLPLLTKHAMFFENAEHKSQLMDSLLHTVYRLSKCRSLTAGQFRTVTDFLVAHTRSVVSLCGLPYCACQLGGLSYNFMSFQLGGRI